MVSSFFAGTVDDWDDPAGMLHAYLVPDGSVLDRLVAPTLALDALPFLAVQPREALHVTVLRFPFLIRSLSESQLAELAAAAGRSSAGTGPLLLDFDEPHATADSVLLRADPVDGWHRLVAAARAAAAEALGEGAGRYAPPPAPHLTLAYATAEGDDGEIEAALWHGAEPHRFGQVVFDRIAWCAVHQNRDAGTYTFETINETPLG